MFTKRTFGIALHEKQQERLAFFDISPVAMQKIFMLQKRASEFSGFIEGIDLKCVLKGHRGEAEYPETCKQSYQYFWHTHSSRRPDQEQINDKDEQECAIRKYRVLNGTLSASDAFLVLEFHEEIPIPSLMISDEFVTRYDIESKEKYRAFKSMKKESGEEVTFQTIVNLRESTIKEISAKVYDRNQGFSFCEDIRIEIESKKKWYDILKRLGLSIEEEKR